MYQFEDIVANVSTLTFIKKAIINDALPKMLILEGSPGTGKSTTAWITALAGTCENRKEWDANPCLECPSCKRAIASMSNGSAKTENIIKVDLGHRKKGDIDELIEEVFMLETSGKKFYIFEEAHSLSKQEQTAFLENIDRMDSNTHIIVCTTNIHALLKEFRSRAITFTFKRLLRKESLLLINKEIKKHGYTKITKEIAMLVIKKTRGTPRDIQNLLEFINNTSPTYEQVLEFLNEIDFKVFSEFISSMFDSTGDFLNSLNNILYNYQLDLIVAKFKEYVLEAIFYLEEGVTEELSNYDKKVLNRVDLKELNVFAKNLFKLNLNCSEADFKFAVLMFRQRLNNKGLAEVIENSKKDAEIIRRSAETNKEITNMIKHGVPQIDELSMEDFINKSID